MTTSAYGSDACAFANNEPITLLNGAELLGLLRKHGYSFRINLQEARQLGQGTAHKDKELKRGRTAWLKPCPFKSARAGRSCEAVPLCVPGAPPLLNSFQLLRAPSKLCLGGDFLRRPLAACVEIYDCSAWLKPCPIKPARAGRSCEAVPLRGPGDPAPQFISTLEGAPSKLRLGGVFLWRPLAAYVEMCDCSARLKPCPFKYARAGRSCLHRCRATLGLDGS